eukprot:5501919-Amphidinium_carterae.1
MKQLPSFTAAFTTRSCKPTLLSTTKWESGRLDRWDPAHDQGSLSQQPVSKWRAKFQRRRRGSPTQLQS